MSFVPAAAGADLAPAALVLVDRLLDPVSPAQHADLLLQRMYDQCSGCSGGTGNSSSGGGSGGGSSTVHVDASCAVPFASPPGGVPMPGLDAAAEPGSRGTSADGDRGPLSLLPGSLRHPDDPQASTWSTVYAAWLLRLLCTLPSRVRVRLPCLMLYAPAPLRAAGGALVGVFAVSQGA